MLWFRSGIVGISYNSTIQSVVVIGYWGSDQMFNLMRTRAAAREVLRTCIKVGKYSSGSGSGIGSEKKVIIIGGCGSLGNAITHRFANENWSCLSVDFTASKVVSTSSILLSPTSSTSASWPEDVKRVREECVSNGFEDVDAVIHAGGSWAGSNVNSNDFPSSLEHLWLANVQSAALSAHLAGKYLKEGGMVALTG